MLAGTAIINTDGPLAYREVTISTVWQYRAAPDGVGRLRQNSSISCTELSL
mgnify:CR=1 FL=1|jgi:hypothetical protein